MAERKRAEAAEAMRLLRAAQLASALSSPLVSAPLKARAAALAARLRDGGHGANERGELAEAHGCFQAAYALQRHPADGISMANMKAKSGDLDGARDDYLELIAAADAADASLADRAADASLLPGALSPRRPANGRTPRIARDARPAAALVAPPPGAALLTAEQRATVEGKLAALDARLNGRCARGAGTEASTRAAGGSAAAPGGKGARPAGAAGAPPAAAKAASGDARRREQAGAEAAAAARDTEVEAEAEAAAAAAAAAAAVAAAAVAVAAAEEEEEERARAAAEGAGGVDDAPIVRALYAAASAAGGSAAAASGARADVPGRPSQDCHFALHTAVGLVVGVLDGHGGAHGAIASRAAADAMCAWLRRPEKARTLSTDAQTALGELFLEGHVGVLDAIGRATGLVDTLGRWSSGGPEVDARVRTPLDADSRLPVEGGTTATVVALVHGRQLLIAHVGDSDAVLGGDAIDGGGGVSAEKLTADHTPAAGEQWCDEITSERTRFVKVARLWGVAFEQERAHDERHGAADAGGGDAGGGDDGDEDDDEGGDAGGDGGRGSQGGSGGSAAAHGRGL
ncbi:hypothetical protein KFE25_001359 [Diacronema lutheri]|uniref:PPM-type phosphatase domain-containing protein n=1 Tax=Diacronema lutheri TaxID=2081491 RepID=A0A8J5X5V6_DIALT|nr:hypothetical protein KFE25_001359 [Diacronema lutheri]